MRVRPMVITESGSRTASFTGAPLSWVPFVEPRSRTWARVPSHCTSTCRREVPESSRVMSASLPRPMTVRPLRIG